MNFIAQVEENLRDLGTEARKKHPGVKEASERAILTLRSLQTQYVSAVRAATAPAPNKQQQPKKQHPTTSLFRSQDVLRPFLLACNYPDASYKLLNIALNAMQLLISGDAVCPSDAVNIVRVLGIQASSCAASSSTLMHNTDDKNDKSSNYNLPQSVMLGIVNAAAGAVYNSTPSSDSSNSSIRVSNASNRSTKEEEMILVKVLQTLAIVVTSRSLDFGEEVVSQSLLVCMAMMWSGSTSKDTDKSKSKLKLHRSAPNYGGQSATKIRKFAIKTLKQVISLLFERVYENESKEQQTQSMIAMKYAASRVIIDLCILCEKRNTPISNTNPTPKKLSCVGPFSFLNLGGNTSASTSIMKSRCMSPLPPPRSFCLELLDMIVSQQASLFFENNEFIQLLQSNIVPLIKSILQDELVYKQHAIDYCLLVRCITLASSIVVQSQKQEQSNDFSLDLIEIMCEFINMSIEHIRDNDTFEDGFVYYNELLSSLPLGDNTAQSKNTTAIHPDTDSDIYSQWRTSLSISALYTIFQSSSFKIFNTDNTKVSSCFSSITESVSNFYILSTSNKNGILQLVNVLEQSQQPPSKKENKVGVFDKALEYCVYMEEWDTFDTSKSTDASYHQQYYPKINVGDTIWLSFQTLFTISKSLSSSIVKTTSNTLVLQQAIFTPSLTLYVHTLRRFPGQKNIVPMALSGFLALANTSLTASKEMEEQRTNERNALISSLCKITTDITSSVRSSSTKELRDYQIEALSCLLYIVHKHYNSITSQSDWNSIVYTLHQLSTYPITNTNYYLSKDMYPTTLALSIAMTRLCNFSACFDRECFICFLEACMELSFALFRQNNVVNEVAVATATSVDEEESYQPQTTSSTLGNKIFSLAGRAFGGVSSTSDTIDDTHATSRTARNTSSQQLHSPSPTPSSIPKRKFGDDARQSILSHIIYTTQSSNATSNSIIQDGVATGGTGSTKEHPLPLSLLLLVDCALVNIYRFNEFGDIVIPHLCDIAAMFVDVRQFVIDIVCHFILMRLTNNNGDEAVNDDKHNMIRIPKGNPAPEYYFVYEEGKREDDEQDKEGKVIDLSQEKLLEPLCKSISTTEDKEYATCGLNALYVILEGVGHNLNHTVWPIIISAIMSLSGCSPDQFMTNSNTKVINRTSSSWSSCSTLAFRCLKLIIDDFLEHLPEEENNDETITSNTRIILLDCCAAFGSSKHDVNTSLTATGMLWTIADQDVKYASLEHVLAKLSYLACDDRAEVRNCSVNTLYSCIVGLGHKFTPEQWKSCVEGTIFGVLDLISSSAADGDDKGIDVYDISLSPSSKKKKEQESRYAVTLHHTRDSKSKQWRTTQVLALRGLERVLRQFFGQLLTTLETAEEDEPNDSIPWFESCWKRIIHLSYTCASNSAGGRENLDLRLAGVDLLVLCAQLSCRDGVSAAALPVRVGTNMQVINGALRRVPNTRKSSADLDTDTTATATTETLVEHRQRLFIAAFETLESFTMGLNDEEEESEDQMFIETARLQVLNKISNGLTQLYDCCKGYELSPVVVYNTTKSYEARFVDMVHSLMLLAVSDKKNQKFLTQAQRTCLDLLRKMASASSSKAFEKLVVIGGKYFVWFTGNDNDGSYGDADSYRHQHVTNSNVELVEQEAAKAVSEAFVEDNVPDIVKTSVLFMILRKSYKDRKLSSDDIDTKLDEDTSTQQQKHPLENISDNDDDNEYSSDDEEEDGLGASYDFLLPIIMGGLKSAFMLEKSCSTTNNGQSSSSNAKDNNDSTSNAIKIDLQEITVILNSLWNRVFTMLSSLLSPNTNIFAPHTDLILQILTCCISVIPFRVHKDFGVVLFNACNKCSDIAKVHRFYSNTNPVVTTNKHSRPDQHEMDACKDALKIFEACFVGLTQCCDYPDNISHMEVVAEAVLTSVIQDLDRKSKVKQKKSYTSTFHEYYNKLIKGDDSASATTNSSPTAPAVVIESSSDDRIDVELELAIIVCDALGSSTSDLTDATLTLFPQLCRLINVHDDRLSSTAGIVLSSLNLADIISNANKEAAEYKERLVSVEEKNHELEVEVQLLRDMNKALQEKVNKLSNE